MDLLNEGFLWQREAWRSFWRQRSLWLPQLLTGLTLLAVWLIILSIKTTQGEFAVIRYSVLLGPSWIAEPKSLYWLPITATLLALLNSLFAYVLGRRTIIIKQLWLWLNWILTLGWLWLAWLIRTINL